MAQVITLGETLVEIMRPDDGTPLDAKGTFLGPYPSGAPAIFADTISRLNHQATLIGCVGDDAFGDCLRTRLRADGVDLRHLRIVSSPATGIAFVSYHGQEREFIYHMNNAAAGVLSASEIPETTVRKADALHLNGSSIAMNDRMRNSCYRANELVADSNCLVSLDPNLRSELLTDATATELLEPVIENCNVVTPTVSEACDIAHTDKTDAAIGWFLDRGCDLVALKRGMDGCTLYTDSETVDIPAFEVTEVDPTGAGDAFSAGIVTALLDDRPLRTVGRFAAAVGAKAVTKQGPMEGVPNRETVDSLVESRPE